MSRTIVVSASLSDGLLRRSVTSCMVSFRELIGHEGPLPAPSQAGASFPLLCPRPHPSPLWAGFQSSQGCDWRRGRIPWRLLVGRNRRGSQTPILEALFNTRRRRWYHSVTGYLYGDPSGLFGRDVPAIHQHRALRVHKSRLRPHTYLDQLESIRFLTSTSTLESQPTQ